MTIRPATDDHATAGDDAPGISTSRAELDVTLKAILVDILGIEKSQADALDGKSGLFGHLPELDSMAVAALFGHLPELDSMAVATLLTEVEDRLDIMIEDDDIDGEMLETYGGLLAFAEAKLTEK